MRKILLPAVLAALALVGQPVFIAGAKTQLFVQTQKDKAESQEQEDQKGVGKPTLFNTVPSSDDYKVPYRSTLNQAIGQKKNLAKAEIPKTWRVLDENTIRNRVNDTRSALAFSATQKKNISQPHNSKVGLGINRDEGDIRDMERKAEKEKKRAEKEKKKAEQQVKNMTEPVDGGEDAQGEEKNKKKLLKRLKKKNDAVPTRKVFNLPD